MRYIVCLLAAFLVLGITSCKQGQPIPAPVQSVLNPIKDVGCAVESGIMGAFGAEVVSECAGSDPAGCGAAFQAVLGNVNLCAAPLPQPAAQPQIASVAVWKKVGDVPDDALKGAHSDGVKPQAVAAKGIVGAIACPIAIQGALGFLTGVIPAACGCKQNLSAGALGSALQAACVTAIPL